MAADITIQLQDGYKVKIHSIVLAASSKFFNEFAEVNSALLEFLMFISNCSALLSCYYSLFS